MPLPNDELLPRRLGGYELLEVIGRGGMGVVYRARHVALDRMVALKLIRVALPEREDVLRFLTEAHVTGQIEHPNIVPVHEIGADDEGRPFFVMKLVRGRGFHDILRAIEKKDPASVAGYPRSRLLEIFCEVCQAVAFAHSKGVLHRDLKPSNVMIGDFGEVLLMDWGLARRFEADAPPPEAGAPSDPARPVVVAGTPEYMSPEQAFGRPGALSPRSDVYSLGAMLFEVLAHRPPHFDADTSRLLRRIATEPVAFPRPGRGRPRAPKALQAIALKALARDPDDRYPTALALWEDVRAFVEDRPVAACPDTLLDRGARLLRRHGALLGTAAAALIVLSIGAALAFWHLTAVETDRRTAAEDAVLQRDLRLSEAEKRTEAEQRARAEAEARARAETAKRAAESLQLQQAAGLARAIPLYLDALELLKRRQYDRAIERLQRVIELDPFALTAALAHFACGEAYERKGAPADARAAIANYREADRVARISNGRGDPRALLRCGEAAWRLLQDAPQALGFYEEAAGVDPENPYGKLARAYALILRGREEKVPAAGAQKAREALDLALQVVKQSDFLWEAHYIAGSLYGGLELPGSGLHDLAQAHQHFSQAVLLEPSNPDSWLGRAAVSRALGDKAAALSDYDTAVRLRPDWVPALQGRGELLLEAGRAAEALRDLERACTLAPDNYALALSRASALLAGKQAPEAEAAATAALKLRPDDPAALALRGRARFAQGRYADAVSDLERAIVLGDKTLPPLQLLATAHLKAGQPAAAAQDFRRILERNPAGSEAWKGLAEALVAQGQVKEALAAYETYLSQQPDDLDVRLQVARLLYADPGAPWDDAVAAVLAAREAERRTRGENPRVQLVLAEALMAAGHADESLQVIERAYTRFPDNAEIQAGRERLRKLKSKPPPKK